MIYAFYKKYNIYLIAAILSIASSMFLLTYHQPFDIDGLYYLHAANSFLHNGLKASIAIYSWPFYQTLIAITSSVTKLSILNSAYLLDGLLDIITLLYFMAIVIELKGSNKIALLAAILLLTHPYFSHFKVNILRGHGYYAFSLLAIFHFIRYFKCKKWRHTLGWGLGIVIATLFRIEGVVMAVLLPFILFFEPRLSLRTKIFSLIKIYSTSILASSIILFYLLGYSHLGKTVDHGPVAHLAFSAHNFLAMFTLKASLIKQSILSPMSFLSTAPSYFLIGGIIGLFCGELLRTFSIPYILLSSYAIVGKAIPNSWYAKTTIFAAIILNVAIVISFAAKHYFLSIRYLGLLYLLLLLFLPFAIAKIYGNWKCNKKSNYLLLITFLAVIYISIGGIGYFGPSKTYLIKAGNWIANNTESSAKLCTNDPQFFYYSKRQGAVMTIKEIIKSKMFKNYDYIAINFKRHNAFHNVDAFVQLSLIKKFQNRRGDKILIYTNNRS